MLAIFYAILTLSGAFQESAKDSRLEMAEPIACRTIAGYEDYQPLDEPVIARTEKLMIYTRFSGQTIIKKNEGYHVHLVQDVNVRRKGQKKVLWGRKRIVEYEATEDYPPLNLYIGTSLGLINFEPGEYEADLILHDENADVPPARRTLSFRLTEPKPTVVKPDDSEAAPVKEPSSRPPSSERPRRPSRG